MDEKQITELMNNLDDEIFCQELDCLMYDMNIEIDMDSIAEKARRKLGKEQQKLKLHKRKILSIIAACLVLMIGVTTVYASEISAFIQSLLGKTGVYSTVVDGSAYYLESPITLDGGRSLSKVMFTDESLDLQFNPGWSSLPDIKVSINGEGNEPQGFGGNELNFYNLTPTGEFDLVVDGKTYPIALKNSTAVTDGSDIVEAEANMNEWVSMGYKKIDGGVQILTTFDDSDLQLHSLVIPESDKVTATFSNAGTGSTAHSYREEFMPLVGYDVDGKAHEYHYDTGDMGRPLTKFTSDAPDGTPITLKVPGIAVGYDNTIANIDIVLPATGEKREVNEEINLSLQKMTLLTVERTSDTTAKLIFELNTGDTANVRIWSADITGNNLESGELLWENGTCTMGITFTEDSTKTSLDVSYPYFIVDGDWEMLIK